MPSVFSRLTPLLVVLFCSFASAQQTQPPAPTKPPQTPRQALIEMITGGGKAIEKHLTVELQQAILQASKTKKPAGSKGIPDLSMMALGLAGMPPLADDKETQTFESGPVLFAHSDPGTKDKTEVRLESDDLSGNQDEMQLSIHIFKDGQEQSVPFMPNIVVGLKQQENVWRLNEIGGNAKLTIGDPKVFEDYFKLQQPSQAEAQLQKHSAEAAGNNKEEPPPMPAASMVTTLAYAEGRYARSNPDVGFTCNIADLVNGKENDFSVIDAQVGAGIYNGHRFSITGCGAKPSTTFHIAAEPLAVGSGSKAYCTDPTLNLRVSDDGRGATCLASGRVATPETGNGMAGFKIHHGPD